MICGGLTDVVSLGLPCVPRSAGLLDKSRDLWGALLRKSDSVASGNLFSCDRHCPPLPRNHGAGGPGTTLRGKFTSEWRDVSARAGK